jgi:hypothetical protein
MTQAGDPGAARAPGPSCEQLFRGHRYFDKELQWVLSVPERLRSTCATRDQIERLKRPSQASFIVTSCSTLAERCSLASMPTWCTRALPLAASTVTV